VQGYLPQIMQVFSKTLNDPESLDVRVTTVRGLGKVGDMLEEDAASDLAAIQSAVPQMVQVLSQCLEQSNSEGAKQVLDVFDTFCILESPILANYLGDLIEFYLNNASNADLEEELREACLNSAIWTCTYKRQKIQQLQLAGPMIQRIMPILVTSEIDLDEGSTPAVIALRLLDTLSTELPPSHVWPPLFEQVQSAMSNPDARYRHAAMLALGISVEGVSETMRPQMDLVWSFVERSLKDPEAQVRSAGCTALTYLCDALGDECIKRHQTAIPTLMQLVGDAEIQRDACRALDAFLENLGDEIKQYLPIVMETLAGHLENTPMKIKQSIIAAIGSAAHASGSEFVPYFQEIMRRLQPFLLFKDKDTDETMEVRAAAQDAIGTFSIAVGKEAFRPYFADIMGHAYDALSLAQPRLNECSFIFFATMAKVFGEEFTPFLPQIMPTLVASLQQLEHDPVPGAAGDGTVNGIGVPGSSAGAADAADDDEDEEFIDMDDLDDIFGNVNSAITVEKEVASDALGEIFKYTKSGFLPYLQESCTQLVAQLQHFSSGNRKAALSSLFLSIDSLNKLMNPTPWQPGLQVVSRGIEKLMCVKHRELTMFPFDRRCHSTRTFSSSLTLW
jgi:importin-4